MLVVDKLRALYQRAGMSAAESTAAVRNTDAWALRPCLAGNNAAHALAKAFVWADSPEGHAYWEGVHARLCWVR